MIRQIFRWMLAITLLSAGLAIAQQEPTMNDIYATAKSGNLSQAQVMVQQVLVAHPNSAKAHFVAAELFGRQGNLPRAREALAAAEKLAPGLPFAKPEAVQALRSQLSATNVAPSVHQVANTTQPSQSSNGWLLPLLLAGGVIVIAYFVFRRRNPEVYAQPAPYNGLNGPQNFGGGGGAVMQPTYGPSPYGQPMYGQPQGGMGSRIMGGVATGLAVGAGVVAAEAIGNRLMGEHGRDVRNDNYNDNNFQPAQTNQDMGGQDFGISDTSWDDGGSGGGGGGDWDN
jgi:hypothetical protein